MPDDVRGAGPPVNGHHTNGSHGPVPPFARSLPDDGEMQLVDLVAVQADDELVNALGARPSSPPPAPGPQRPGRDAGGPPVGPADPGMHPGERGADDRLVAMLAAWRAEIDAEPIPELVDLDTAVAAVTSGIAQHSMLTARRRRAGRLRQLAPLAAAAAIIVATVTGVGLGSQNAVPGDTLWPIQKVVDPERAESVEAKVKVESRLETVRTALTNGDTATAARELDAIRTEIPAVRGQEGQPELVQEQTFLAAKLADTKPGQHADLSTPPTSNPAARSTGSPATPAPPPVDASKATAPSESSSASKPKPTAPDAHKGATDRSKDAVTKGSTGGTVPDAPPPDRPAPEVTAVPVPLPQPQPEPGPPGKDEGKPDPTVNPGPVEQPPPSGTDGGTSPGSGGGGSGNAGGGDNADGGGSSGTTTAAGAAGASVDTTATDTTS